MIFTWFLVSILLMMVAIFFIAIPFVRAKNYFMATAMAIVTLLSTLLFYSYYGQADAVAQWLNHGKKVYQVRREFMTLGTFEQIIQQIKDRIAQNESDPQGWFLLGRLYYTQEMYHEASIAFSKAYALHSTDSSILLNYARSLYFENKNNKEKSQALAEKAKIYSPKDAEINEFLQLISQA